uniref:GDSL esterase/lipase At1g71691-like n=1 Tax=Erigeron canadensis TaxID=72917 RepID=UPI001CB8BB43|nr:GDSL esterase/lipase At1g71691-like [Erigeron canadensis]
MGGKEMMNLKFCCLLWVLMVGVLWSGSRVVVAQDYDNVGGVGDGFSSPGTTWGNNKIVPAMYIFGDSLIDNGNNNDLNSFAKANYFPYGIDFNGGPTGRFSNGYTMIDEIAQLLGLPLIPAYSEASHSGDQMVHGVNFASAASGILDITGRNFVGRIPFNQQIKNFEDSLDQISGNMGPAGVSQMLSRSLFFVGMGSNDYLNNYLMPNYNTRNQYNGQQFADLLSKEYTTQLTKLYNLGARKFVLAGLGLMGCIPSILAQSTTPGRGCSQEVNQLVLPFNANMRTMINNLSINLPGSKFIFVDVHNMFQDLLANARSYGFRVVDRGCCGIGRHRGQITCLPFQTPCPNRNEYVFWDAFHPTEAVNVLMGRKAFSGTPDSVYPINIQQLANI